MRGAALLMWSSIPDEGKLKTAVSTTDYLLWSEIQPDDNCLWWGNAQGLSLLSASACKESPRRGHCWCRQRPAGYAGPHVVRELSVGLSWSTKQLWLQKHTRALEVPLPTKQKWSSKNWFIFFIWTQESDPQRARGDYFPKAKPSKYPETCSGHMKNRLDKIIRESKNTWAYLREVDRVGLKSPCWHTVMDLAQPCFWHLALV